MCHPGLDLACPVLDTGDSSVCGLDSRFRGNDSLRANVRKGQIPNSRLNDT